MLLPEGFSQFTRTYWPIIVGNISVIIQIHLFQKKEAPIIVWKMKASMFEKKYGVMWSPKLLCLIYLECSGLMWCTTLHVPASVPEAFKKHITSWICIGKLFMITWLHLFSKNRASSFSTNIISVTSLKFILNNWILVVLHPSFYHSENHFLFVSSCYLFPFLYYPSSVKMSVWYLNRSLLIFSVMLFDIATFRARFKFLQLSVKRFWRGLRPWQFQQRRTS